MNYELKILAAAIKSREDYNRTLSLVDKEDFSDQGIIILDEITKYYTIDNDASKVDKDILISRITGAYPKAKDIFKDIVSSIDLGVSVPNLINEILALKLSSVKYKLSAAFASDSNNKSEINQLLEEYENLSYGELTEKEEEKYNIIRNPNLEDIFNEASTENRIQIYPLSLNEKLSGGAKRGHHIVFFGRPEIGKTAFLLNMCYGFLKQNLIVLYIGNEDPANDIIERFLWRLSGLGAEECRSDYKKVQEIVEKRNFSNFIFCDVDDGTIEGIRNLVDEFRPDVLVVDQARNLSFKDNTNKVINLELASQGIRKIAKRYKLVGVSAFQAGDSAENKLFLDMGDIDFSNTGVQGTADLMIGMGATEEYKKLGMRVLTICKNKLSLDRNPVRVKINPTMSMIK